MGNIRLTIGKRQRTVRSTGMGGDEIGGRDSTTSSEPGREVWVEAKKTNRKNANKKPKPAFKRRQQEG